MGSIPIKTTNLANIDPVFKGVKSGFYALSVHQQYADDLPENLDLLAYTQQCLHSFKLRDKPLWAFQFHPEVDRATVFERLAIYKTKYTSGEEEFNKVLDSLVETPDSHKLMLNCVDNVYFIILKVINGKKTHCPTAFVSCFIIHNEIR